MKGCNSSQTIQAFGCAPLTNRKSFCRTFAATTGKKEEFRDEEGSRLGERAPIPRDSFVAPSNRGLPSPSKLVSPGAGRGNGNISHWRSWKLTSAAATAGPTTYDGKYRGKLPGLAGLLAPNCSREPPDQIDRAVGALLALALDLAVADQAIEPRAGLASIKGADQPRDRGAGYPTWDRSSFKRPMSLCMSCRISFVPQGHGL
jgi:hypothetical protein